MVDFLSEIDGLNAVINLFNEQVQDNFGSSIVDEVLTPINRILEECYHLEECEKTQQLIEVDRLLLEARSIAGIE